MKTTLELAETAVSKLKFPKPAIWVANKLLDRQNLTVGPEVNIARNCKIRGDVTLEPYSSLGAGCELIGDITIGERTNLNRNIEVVGEVEIGKYCALARDILFQEKNHVTSQPAMQMRFYSQVLDSKLDHTSKGQITVGSDVWIGARAIILSGVSIGHGAVIGAGSIVTDDVEPYSVVAGVPGKRVAWRFNEDIRNRFLELEWWDYPDDVLQENREFFEMEIQSVDDIPDL